MAGLRPGQDGGDRGQKRLDVLQGRALAHQAHAPDTPGERTEPGADLDIEALQEVAPDSRLIRSSRHADGIQRPEPVSLWRQKFQTELLETCDQRPVTRFPVSSGIPPNDVTASAMNCAPCSAASLAIASVDGIQHAGGCLGMDGRHRSAPSPRGTATVGSGTGFGTVSQAYHRGYRQGQAQRAGAPERQIT